MKNGLYIPVETRVSVFFEKEHINCACCPFFETYSREQCRLSGEYIINKHGRGYYCRLELPEEAYEYSRETDTDTAGA
uniref:Uncharacterized protein n=1 Tax=Siphoviridae sp. ctSMg55 TaxID=2825509 RepID=A0A8S5V4X1_9CAUD|nr:MAG TPA: hypothetical protein [Siphoviridae sp. ctSMg55]